MAPRHAAKGQSRPRLMERIMQAQALDSHQGVYGRAGRMANAFSPARPRPNGVEAGLSYLAPTAERPYSYMYDPPAGIARQNCEYRLRPVWIGDARAMASPPSIHVEGFELWDAPTSIEDFEDEDAIRNRYYGEAAELAKCVTGADQAFIFDHQVRQRETGRPALTLGRRGDVAAPALLDGSTATIARPRGRSASRTCPWNRPSNRRPVASPSSTFGARSAGRSLIRLLRSVMRVRSP
jgi:hypothetical protein